MSSFISSSRAAAAGALLVVGAGALAACSAGGSSSGSSSAAVSVSASPGGVPQVGQVVASAPLSSGGFEASRCGGRDMAAMGTLQAAARERGWVVDHGGTDSEGCFSSASMPVAGGQRATLLIEEDQGAGTASLRVVDIAAASAPASVSGSPSAPASTAGGEG